MDEKILWMKIHVYATIKRVENQERIKQEHLVLIKNTNNKK